MTRERWRVRAGMDGTYYDFFFVSVRAGVLSAGADVLAGTLFGFVSDAGVASGCAVSVGDFVSGFAVFSAGLLSVLYHPAPLNTTAGGASSFSVFFFPHEGHAGIDFLPNGTVCSKTAWQERQRKSKVGMHGSVVEFQTRARAACVHTPSTGMSAAQFVSRLRVPRTSFGTTLQLPSGLGRKFCDRKPKCSGLRSMWCTY